MADSLQKGSEIIGPRLTVYNLLVDFLDPTKTEGYICKVYQLTPEQVAAARAYILNNPDTVMDRHLQIEARNAAGNPPEVIEQAKKTRATFKRFKEWVDARAREDVQDRLAENAATDTNGKRLPSFREWLAEQESANAQGSCCTTHPSA